MIQASLSTVLHPRGHGRISLILAGAVIGVLIGLMLLVTLTGSMPTPGEVGEHSDLTPVPPGPSEVTPPVRPVPGEDEAPPVTRPEVPDYPREAEVYFRMIVLRHRELPNAPTDVTRSRAEALAHAREVRAMLPPTGTRSFEELVEKYSEDPSRQRGGRLPRMTLGQMPPVLASAVWELSVGDISDPVDSEHGIYIFQRLGLPPEMASQHIVVMFEGGQQVASTITRTREEASRRAHEALRRALDGEDFEALIAEYSDHPSKVNRGLMGIWTADRIDARYAAAAATVEEWEVVPELVETPQGFFIIRRLPLEETEPLVPWQEPVPEPTAEVDPARVPGPDPREARGERACGYSLLITWEGAQRANRRIKRTREEALARAQALVRLARSRDQDVLDLISSFSEVQGVEATGGSLGLLPQQRAFLPEHHELFRLAPGQVSDPVETERGYQIVYRVPIEEVALRDIVVSYQGATNATPTLERTREQALARIQEAEALLQGGASFAEVAGKYSDQRARTGGGLGVLYRGHPFFMRFPRYAELGFDMGPGEVSDIFETEWGYHLIMRDEPVRARQILIAFKGCVGARGPAAERTRDEAQARAEEILQRVRAGESMASLVEEYTDDPRRPTDGDTGIVGPGQRPENWLAALQALEVGQVSEPVRTRWGFHVMERLPLELPSR